MNQFHIRKLEVHELYKLSELFTYHNLGDMIQENTNDMAAGVIDIFALCDNEKLIGELHTKYISNDDLEAVKGIRAYLFAFRIHQEYQSRGLGRLLLGQVLDILSQEGYTEYTVGVEDENELARHLYESFGFTRTIARKTDCYQDDCYEYDLLLKRLHD